MRVCLCVHVCWWRSPVMIATGLAPVLVAMKVVVVMATYYYCVVMVDSTLLLNAKSHDFATACQRRQPYTGTCYHYGFRLFVAFDSTILSFCYSLAYLHCLIKRNNRLIHFYCSILVMWICSGREKKREKNHLNFDIWR